MPADEVVCLECNLDDMTPEALGYALERLLEAGALDAWFTPIYMKKNRPATMLSALCRPEEAPRVRQAMLEHTSTLGVRYTVWQREIAERRSVTVETPWGVVRCKVKLLEGRAVGAKPEFDDCARLAREAGVPVQIVMDAARAALDAGA